MLNIVILAAGAGKRMQSDLPKVLHTLAGRPMLFHVLDSARALTPHQMVVVTGHGAEVVQDRLNTATDVAFARQQPQLGTGHAVQQAMPLLPDEGTTLVLYGDVPLVSPDTLRKLLDATGDGLGVLTVHETDPTGYGRIVRDANGAIQRIVEHKDASEAERAITEVNTGIVAAPTAHLKRWLAGLRNDNAQGEYYLTDIVGAAVADGLTVRAAQPDHAWETQGVNSRTQQAALERQFQRHQADTLMAAGVTVADPARLDVRGTLHCGRDVFIDVGCVFEGTVRLDDGVHIGPHCVLRDVQVGAGSRVEAFSHLVETHTEESVQIGPYARLRPGTRLARDVHVGNFVEIKNSTLGVGTKAGHLSYLGDATLGARVNVGAGTITCNYDGVNKHRTEVGDDVFIGSDSQLVAPVCVGDGATLGAGTTLTRDAPAGQLTVSRVRQTTVEKWQRPVKQPKRG